MTEDATMTTYDFKKPASLLLTTTNNDGDADGKTTTTTQGSRVVSVRKNMWDKTLDSRTKDGNFFFSDFSHLFTSVAFCTRANRLQFTLKDGSQMVLNVQPAEFDRVVKIAKGALPLSP